MSEGAATAARAALIRAELTRIGVVPGCPPVWPRLEPTVLDELQYALYPPVHEGRVGTYGAIVALQPDIAVYEDLQKHSPCMLCFGGPIQNREAADGRSSFAYIAPPDPPKVVCFERSPATHEVLAFAVRDDALYDRLHRPVTDHHDFVVIQRTETEVRMLCGLGVVSVRDNVWSLRQYQYEFLLDDLVAREWPEHEDLPRIARSISRLVVHLMSPARIGGTIVLMINACAEDVLLRDNQVPLDPEAGGQPFTWNRRAHHWAVASLLDKHDGALIVRADGTLEAANVFFNIKPTDQPAPSLGGSRQLSAREGSKHIDGVVLTVSSDGPVRAYLRGELALTTVPHDLVPDAPQESPTSTPAA